MKIAVCISGGIKHYEKSLESLKKIYPNDFIKVFIHTYDISDEELYKNNSCNHIGNKYSKTIKNLNEVLSLYKYEDILVEKFEDKVEHFTNVFNNANFIWVERNDLGPISMFYSIFKSNELKINYENNNNFKFDRVLRMRFDSDFKNDEDLDVSLDYNLVIPSGRDWGGLNDQFAFGKSETMDVYCDLINNINKYYDQKFHPESLLYRHISFNNINPYRLDYRIEINLGINNE